MKEIGDLLVKKRESMNLTCEDISEKTKIPVALLKALEAGDIDYFKHDMSYVKYYLRSYCNAVDLDYEEIKSKMESSVNDYTNTMTIKKIHQQDLTEKGIAEKTGSIRYSEKIVPRDMKKQKIDFALISMIVVAAALMICIGYVIFHWVTAKPETSAAERNEKVVETTSLSETEESDLVEEEVTSTMKVTEEQADEYIFTDWTEGQECSIIIDFNERTWVQVEIDGTKTQNPSSRIYEKGESIEINTTAEENRDIGIHLGYYASNVFTVNGEQFDLDESVANKESGYKIHFIFKGEEE